MVKKMICMLLCAALLAALLPGCKPQQEEIVETAVPTQGVTEVELELPVDERPYVGVQLRFLSQLSEADARAGVLAQAARVFEARTGAQVELAWIPEGDDALAEQFRGIEQIDIFSASADAVTGQLLAEALDLTAMAEAAGYAQHSYSALRNQIARRCGYLAAIPQEPRIYGMYYNADAFADAGVTDYPESWDDFLNLSERLVQKGYMPLCMDIQNAHLALELHLERHLGLDKFKNLLGTGGWTKENAYIELFRLAINYAGAGYLAKGDPSEFPDGQDKLAVSNVAMVAGSNDLCAQVERSTMMDVNWGVFPYPGDGPGLGYGVESQTLAVHRDSEHPQAAFDFIMLLTTGEFDQLYADVSGSIPADPQNESAIAGAGALLEKSDGQQLGVLNPKDNELFSRLWNGWYKTPSYFASAMNGLAKDYAEFSNQGVG